MAALVSDVDLFSWPLFDVYLFSIDIVHAVSYSLLLLNTDLHVAELSTRMSRNQFVRNTLTTIQMQLQPTSAATLSLSSSDLTYDDCSSSVRGSGTDETEVMSRSKRSDSIASWNSLPRETVMSLPIGTKSNHSGSLGAQLPNGSSPSVQVSIEHAHGRAWENDMESLLKVGSIVFMAKKLVHPVLTTGNLQCDQESADSSTDKLKCHSVLCFIVESWRWNDAKSKPASTT